MMRAPSNCDLRAATLEVIPSLDLLDGRAVRLTHGDFTTAISYGDPEEVLDSLGIANGSRLHVVDLDGSRRGRPVATSIVRRLARRDLRIQVGGGIRSLDDARAWIDCGAERLVVGTVAAEAPALLSSLEATFGADRIIPAIDVRDGIIRVAGWERDATVSVAEVFARIEGLGIGEALVTEISRDGALRGPSFDLYRTLTRLTKVRIIASGGVSNAADIVSLRRLGNVSGCVIGKALLERRVDLREMEALAGTPDTVPIRVIPCLDMRDGRVVKGVRFENIRDAGDPVECARRYEEEGADELIILDISATDGNRTTALDMVRRVSETIFIPLTIGGGVRSVEDFRSLLRAGADRVAINTAAIRDPHLISECAREFGVQAVVLSCDARAAAVPHGDKTDPAFEAMVRSGKEGSGLDAVEWCRRAEQLGCGEILLTSVDRDGTNAGFDIDLLRAVTSAVNIGVIASGGAGRLEHFREAVESGGARAVLAATLFHDRVLSVRDVKKFLAVERIPVR
jgi:phosphoribosylformimino-5-aminoimidazole carboxamide ribotide isomerase